MPSKLDPSSLSLVALCCGTVASAVIAFDPLPHGAIPAPQSAIELIAPARAAPVDTPRHPAADRDFDMP
jgi:hypothetical protein